MKLMQTSAFKHRGISGPSGFQVTASLILGAALMTSQALATNQPDREDFTRDFQKNLTLPTGQVVRLEHRQGNVTVRTHTERELKLQASIRVSAPDKQEAAQFGNQIQILVDQTAAGVSIRTQYPQESSGLFSGPSNSCPRFAVVRSC